MTRFAPMITALCLGLPAQAEELRTPPDYYVSALFAVPMAEALATSCPTVGMDLLAAGAATTQVRERLAEDGFDPEAPNAGMEDLAPILQARQAAFLEKHPELARPSAEVVCAVALIEIDDATDVGTYLFAGVE